MRTPKKFVSIRINEALFKRFKDKLRVEGKQQTTVTTRLIEGWVKGKYKV